MNFFFIALLIYCIYVFNGRKKKIEKAINDRS